MSFWDDLYNAFTAPIRATGNFVDDIAHGRSVVDSISTHVSSTIAGVQAPGALVLHHTPIEGWMDKVSPYYLGITGGIANQQRLAYQSGVEKQEISSGQFWHATGDFYKAGAAVVGTIVGAQAISAGASGATAVGETAAGIGAEQKLLNGDFTGAGQDALGAIGVPDEYKGIAGEGKKIADQFPKGDDGGPGGGGNRNPSGSSSWGSSSGVSSGSGLSIPVAAVLAVAAVGVGAVILKRRRR